MIRLAAELWVMLAFGFLLGCPVGLLLHRGLRRTIVPAAPVPAHPLRDAEPPSLMLLPPPDAAAVPKPEPFRQRPPERPQPMAEMSAPAAVAAAKPMGLRPIGLSRPRVGGADDLTMIRGLGKRYAAKLSSIGIFHFRQIAAWTPDEVAWIEAFLNAAGTATQKDWVGQAVRLASLDDPAAGGRRPKKPPRPRSMRGKAKKKEQAEDLSADLVDEADDA